MFCSKKKVTAEKKPEMPIEKTMEREEVLKSDKIDRKGQEAAETEMEKNSRPIMAESNGVNVPSDQLFKDGPPVN